MSASHPRRRNSAGAFESLPPFEGDLHEAFSPPSTLQPFTPLLRSSPLGHFYPSPLAPLSVSNIHAFRMKVWCGHALHVSFFKTYFNRSLGFPARRGPHRRNPVSSLRRGVGVSARIFFGTQVCIFGNWHHPYGGTSQTLGLAPPLRGHLLDF